MKIRVFDPQAELAEAVAEVGHNALALRAWANGHGWSLDQRWRAEQVADGPVLSESQRAELPANYQAVAGHPDYGQGAGAWSSEEVKREALSLDSRKPVAEIVERVIEILERHGYDSIDRELAFWHYSQVMGVDYDNFYDAWMDQ